MHSYIVNKTKFSMAERLHCFYCLLFLLCFLSYFSNNPACTSVCLSYISIIFTFSIMFVYLFSLLFFLHPSSQHIICIIQLIYTLLETIRIGGTAHVSEHNARRSKDI